MNDVIVNLIYVTKQDNGAGFDVDTEGKTEVYAKTKSVKYTQKYLAMQSGMKPDIALEVRAEDWELTKHIINNMPEYATKVELDGSVYNIMDNYSPDGLKVFLTLGR